MAKFFDFFTIFSLSKIYAHKKLGNFSHSNYIVLNKVVNCICETVYSLNPYPVRIGNLLVKKLFITLRDDQTDVYAYYLLVIEIIYIDYFRCIAFILWIKYNTYHVRT